MKKDGFTLIELLVVVIIISTLASISAPTYLRTIERFRVVEATTAITEIKKAEEEVYLRKGKYSDDFSDLNIEIRDKDGELCSGKACNLKYFSLQIKITGNSYQIIAQRKSDVQPPPQRYSPNYIYFYDSKTQSFLCNDANCARDFL